MKSVKYKRVLGDAKNSRNKKHKYGKYSTFYIFFFFLATYIYDELLFRLKVGESFFNAGLLYILIFAVPCALFFYMLASVGSKKFNSIATLLICIIQFLLYASQIVYNGVFGKLYIFNSVKGATQVLQFWKVTLITIGKESYMLILLALPIVFYFVVLRKKSPFKRLRWQLCAGGTLLSVVLHFLCVLIILLSGNETLSSKDIYFDRTYALDMRVNRFGLIQGFRRDILYSFGNDKGGLVIEPVTPATETESESQSESESSQNPSSETEPISETETEPELDTSPNIMNIDFDKLIAEESDSDIKTMHEYFKSVTPTNKNEYTGMFEGYNIIHITAEGFSDYVVDEKLTPTLYKMAHEGFDFTNYYCPIWGVSTSDGEYTNCTSLVPKAGTWSFRDSGLQGNNMYFCLGNQFERLGYQTYAFHNNTYTYYRREVSHPNMGYTYYGLGNGLEVKKTWPESDVEMMDLSVQHYLTTGEPFSVYYMTVSGHLEYNFNGNMMSWKHHEETIDMPNSEAVRAYYSCNIELDLAMEALLEYLNAAGVAEKTLIVMSPDHYPYGLTEEQISEILGHKVETNFEMYKTRLIMYCQGMKPEVIDKPCYSIDILPTISNLMGLEYDSRLLMGTDIFSDSSPLIVFLNRSWITDKMTYNATPDIKKYTNLTDTEMSDDYKNSINSIVKNKFTFSQAILDYDYYGILFGKDD